MKCQKFKACWEKFKFYPSSKFKVKWDLFIILLALYNSIFVPAEFSFNLGIENNYYYKSMTYMIDFIFIFDVIVNFRSVYYDSVHEEYVTDGRKIALNYILKGRFWVDMAASIPIEEIYSVMQADSNGKSSNSNSMFKLISLFKLIRLLRLGRIITYLKMNQTFKFGMKFLQLFLILIMVLHWVTCFWYYIIGINQSWFPPKDIGKENLIIYNNDTWFAPYILTFYYSLLGLVGNEMMPTTTLEIGISGSILLLGSIVLTIIVSNFSSIIGEISKKASMQNEV